MYGVQRKHNSHHIASHHIILYAPAPLALPPCPVLSCPKQLINAKRDLYPAWRWTEKVTAVEEAKKEHGLKEGLPDFYNMQFERPREDARGYGLLYVDVSVCCTNTCII